MPSFSNKLTPYGPIAPTAPKSELSVKRTEDYYLHIYQPLIKDSAWEGTLLGQSGACAQPSDRESEHQAHQGQEEQFLEGKVVGNRNKCLQPFPTTNPIFSGPQADEILQEYLKSKESVTDAILQTDQTLSEKEKLIEGEEPVKRLDSPESS